MFFPNRGYDPDRSPWATAGALTATAVVATSGYCLFQLVQAYGWEGAVSYIWEGDPHPAHVRDRIHKLDSLEKTLGKKERVLTALEEGLERSRLDSVDGSDDAHVRQQWENNVTAKDLKKSLSLLSYDLDQCASGIDDVKSGDQAEIKARKKSLSTRAVPTKHSLILLAIF